MKTPIELICSDIDGTLLDHNRDISAKTIQSTSKIKDIPFILISSRMPQAMVYLQEKLGILNQPLIAYNGGLIVHHDQIIDSTEIDIKTVEAICDFCRNLSLHTSLYHANEWHVDKFDYWAQREKNNTQVHPNLRDNFTTIFHWKTEKKGAHKIMCMGYSEEIDSLEKFIESHLSDQIIGYRSKPTYLEISPLKTNKKLALSTLLKHSYPKVSLKKVMAFGDNYNDIDLLSAVGVGVAMLNAKDEVKQSTKHQTLSNIEDGVAHFIDDFFG